MASASGSGQSTKAVSLFIEKVSASLVLSFAVAIGYIERPARFGETNAPQQAISVRLALGDRRQAGAPRPAGYFARIGGIFATMPR